MGTIEAALAFPKTAYWAPGQRSSHDGERDLMGVTHWCAMARLTRAVWSVGQRVQSISPLERSRRLGSSVGTITGTGRHARRTGLGDPFCRWEHRSRPSACSRGKKSSPATEALGRSRGGFSTKIHVRCDGKGKPITFLLT